MRTLFIIALGLSEALEEIVYTNSLLLCNVPDAFLNLHFG